jgi:primosomal protein N' (replication factor Y)
MTSSSSQKVFIIRVALPIPLNSFFDYLAPKAFTGHDLPAGCRVLVPFGKFNKVGFVVECPDVSHIKIERLKYIIEILDESSLIGEKDRQLLQWASQYYHYPLGEVYSAAFPASLRKGKKAELKQENYYSLSSKGKLLNAEQLKKAPKQKQLFEYFQNQKDSLSATKLRLWGKNGLPTLKGLLEKELISIELKNKYPSKKNTISEMPLIPNKQQSQAIDLLIKKTGQFSVSLLEGVTGSGKTEVYMQVIQHILDLGQQVLVLLPEITLTPQLQERFNRRFSVAISISHSKLTETQRHTSWLEIQQGHSSILLGTRSALFTPFKNLGLIILDEEHDASFKQQQKGFLFSARDLAIVKAKIHNIPAVLGTATPSLESLYNVEKKRYQLLHLSERAGVAIKPTFLLFDIRNKKLQDGLSEPLIAHIKKTLAKKEQVLLFLNRRGFAPVLICHACAWVARCNHCDSNLVIHSAERALRCHHCGHQQHLLNLCPSCITGELDSLGLGTEKVEQGLHNLFPDQKIIRLDRDSTQRKGSLENHLNQINEGKVDIILGTQMLAKGHHFPNVTLVAILDVDSGLFSIDFHSTERLAQLITQVAGRAGRAEKPGKVILQTRQPEHPLLTLLLEEGYRKFSDMALLERQQAALPPFSSQALLRVYASNSVDPQSFLQAVCMVIQTINHNNALILGPVSAPMAKRAGNFHFQLLLQHSHRKYLQALLNQLTPKLYNLKEGKKVRWSIDVDPIDLY